MIRKSPTLCAALFLVLVLQPLARAQPPANPEEALAARLLHQRFVLTSFSAATHIKGTWDGRVLTLDPTPWHILALLTVDKLKLKGNKLKIEATRNQLLRDNTGKIVTDPLSAPVELTLTLQGDPATLAPTLPNALFFPSLDAALAAIPKPFHGVLPGRVGALLPTSKPHPLCDCADPQGTCTAIKDIGMQPPRVLHSVEPEFSDEARNKKINGTVQIGIQVDATGAIADEWIVCDLGYGLDERAARAVSKYKFAPATCHNKPISFALIVNVAFAIH